jgi:hypothetical protein
MSKLQQLQYFDPIYMMLYQKLEMQLLLQFRSVSQISLVESVAQYRPAATAAADLS